MKNAFSVAAMPEWAALCLRLLPTSLLDHALLLLAESIKNRHPDIVGRMRAHAAATFVLQPSDMRLAFIVRPSSRQPMMISRKAPLVWDARICGSVAALLAMLHGALDGDALFFSGDISMEGDTEAVLALRNALDSAELDLPSEMAALLGPFQGVAQTSFRETLPYVEHLMGGVALRRRGDGAL